MTDRDPPRLTAPGSDAPDLLRDALSSARSDVPDGAHLARLAARLPPGLPPGGGGPLGGAPLPTATPSVLSGALIGAALGVLVSGAALVWDGQRARPPAASAPRPVSTASLTAPPAAPEAPRREPAPAPAPVPAPTSSASASTAPPPAPPVAGGATIVAPSAPSATPVPVAGLAGAAPAPVEVETEAHLLQRAQDALSARPAEALARTEEHAARFPSGSLGQERELTAIQALFRLGRVDEARARAGRFVAIYPGSAHRRRIEALFSP